MHKLNRPAAPVCLSQFQLGTHTWDDVFGVDKDEIWVQLEQMQGARCAYCEAQLVLTRPRRRNSAHIEHFRQKNPRIYPQGTFIWSNLFGSCKNKQSCGEHKDRYKQNTGYSHQDLIKMDVEDPDDFLHFLSDGQVTSRVGISPSDKHRAEETIRIFNLNSLRYSRYGYIRANKDTQQLLRDYKKMAVLAPTDEERAEWIQAYEEELAKAVGGITGTPFETAIRHAIQN